MKRFILLCVCGLLGLTLSIGCSEKLEGPLGPEIVFDTTVIVTPADTVFDTTVVGPDTVIDTIFFPPDTITQTDTIVLVDTVEFTDTLVDTIVRYHIDTIVVTETDTVVDTVFIPEYDTVIVTDTVIDTVFVPTENLVFRNCRFWKLKDGQMSVEVHLENPAGTYLVGFERIRLTTQIPESLELIVDFGNGQVFQKSVHGDQHFVDWSGPVELSENATVTISLDEPWFAGKITDASCREYFKGFWWFGVRAPE